MNFRRLAKPLAAAILTLGVLATGVAPANAAILSSTGTSSAFDTGWG